MARLGDVFVLIRNGASIKQAEGAGGIPITRIETISNREVDRNKFGYAGIQDIQKYSDYILQNNDILMSHINSEKHLGKAAIYQAIENEQIIHGMNLLILRADFDMVHPKYAFYFFETPFFQQQIVRITKKSVNQASFTVTSLKDIEIPLPTLEIQMNVADILDKVSNLISLRKQQLAKLDELVKARFVEMFGDLVVNTKEWTFQKLSTLCDVRDGTHDSPEYVSEGYPLLTSQNFTSGIIDFTNCNLISEENFEQINRRSKVDCGDIIMPMIGTIGHPVIVDTNRPFAIKNVALIKFNKEEISNIFVKTVLDSDYFLNVTTANNRGGTQKFIALGDIRSIPIPIVPRECQVVFADFAGEAARQKLTIQQSLDKLKVLKKSLMQEYFG